MSRLALLWHLHQPDYRDPADGRPVMPWVRLHALRGYRDLFLESVERGLPVTINVVPSLVDQMLWYAEGGDDRHLALTRRPADALRPDEVEEVCASLPAGHPAMTHAWPAYAELRQRVEGGETPTVGMLRDLQVWATLSWFGATAHRDFPRLGELGRKGRGFTEDDKRAVLEVQDAIVGALPDQLRAVVEADGPTVSTTPYFHPILPLVVDARHALRCMPDLPDEVDFAWPQDALRQLVSARERLAELHGAAPVGLWPSEGSVSPEVVALAGEAGFRWLATDVGVLARSDRTGGDRPGGWDLGHGVVGFFRDTELSDRVGFRYAGADPVESAFDLAASAHQRAEGGTLLVALDGENPWESFRDAGGAFRGALYDLLERGDPVRAVTVDEAAEEPVVGTVTRLHTGSWIGADFRIWIGHPEDRAAWQRLAAARAAAEEAEPAVRERAMPHLLAAEGSDWTWWYGDDFRTPWAGTFDALFRAHLRAAWRKLGRPPPADLDRPISTPYPPQRVPPQRALEVAGFDDRWLGWSGAGELRAWGGAMATGAGVHRVRFGWNRSEQGAGALWLRAEVRGEGWRARVEPDEGVEQRQIDATLLVCVPSGRGRVQLFAPDGSQWPEEPVALSPPARPDHAWWEV